MYPPRHLLRAGPVLGIALGLLALAAPLGAQSDWSLTPGDVVRVDHDFVGTVMSIAGGSTITVLGEGEPTCWPGIQHGEAPRCDPAPSIRRVVDWDDVTLERQLEGVSFTKRTLVGLVLGAAVFAPVGYATGPSLGYGKIDGCVEVSATNLCTDPITPVEFASLQRSQDQRRGAFAFALLGGSIGAIIARKTANPWIEVRPPSPVGGADAWSLSVRLPTAHR